MVRMPLNREQTLNLMQPTLISKFKYGNAKKQQPTNCRVQQLYSVFFAKPYDHIKGR